MTKKNFVVVALLAILASACSGLKSSPTAPSATSKNVAAETLPATHQFMDAAGNPTGATVTVFEAILGEESGPGRYFRYWQDPLPVFGEPSAELHGTKGEVVKIGTLTRGAIMPIGDLVPDFIQVPGPNGSSTRFQLIH